MAFRFLARQAKHKDSVKDTSLQFYVRASKDVGYLPDNKESDEKRLKQRQKQIDLGKNTESYLRYIKSVPKKSRKRRGRIPLDPATPDIFQKCSKRSWDGQVKAWRRQLHLFAVAEKDKENIHPKEKDNVENKRDFGSTHGTKNLEYILGSNINIENDGHMAFFF